jgi:hypothetical protein
LKAALELLDRAAHGGGPREIAALCFQLDRWLEFDAQPRLSDGRSWPESGHALADAPQAARWLLPGGRLLEMPFEPSLPALERSLDEPDLDLASIAAQLQSALIRAQTEPLSLDTLEGPALQHGVAELVALAWELEGSGREQVLRILIASMRKTPGWELASARLKACFEQGLGDRDAGVRAISVGALVDMAVGRLPAPQTADPHRSIAVLLRMPRTDLKVAALAAIQQLPEEALDGLSETLTPLLRELLVSADPELRRLAGELQLQLAGGGDGLAIARDLRASESALRLEALDRAGGLDRSGFEPLVGIVLDICDDPDAALRRAALELLARQEENASPSLRRRIAMTLLASSDASAVESGLRSLGKEGRAGLAKDAEALKALRDALDGPEASRHLVAEVWLNEHRELSSEALVDGYRPLLQHVDPVLRQAVLRDLSARPPDRQSVRDALFKLLVERLQDAEPSLRIEAGRAILAMDYPHAEDIVTQLVFDRDRYVRHAVPRLLEGRPGAGQSATLAGHVEQLFDRIQAKDGDGRQAWTTALRAVLLQSSPRLPAMLVALLSAIPADSEDAFDRFAMEEIDAALIERSGEGEDLLLLCRRLIEPPDPQPDHALRLAATRATEDPQAMDFIWTCYLRAGGAASKSAARVLAGLAGLSKAPAVQAELLQLLARTETGEARQLLLRLTGRPA